MRLKLSGPDYKDKDPVQSLLDFKKRVQAYESAYVPLGDYEESHDMQYIKVRPDRWAPTSPPWVVCLSHPFTN